MMSEKTLSIIVVNYNTRDFLKDCLHSIKSTQDGLETEIIVVDNNSRDGSATMVEALFPETELIANQKNIGYAKAVNQGIKASEGEYILILNADAFVKPQAIQALLSFLQKHPEVGIAGPKLRYTDGRLQHSCRTFYDFKTLLWRRTFLGRFFSKGRILENHLMLDWAHDCRKEVDWVLGAAMMVRRTVLGQVGLMDERYFLYFEDVDWCYRMKNAGWKVYYVPDAEMVHHYRQGSRAVQMFNRDVLIHLISMFRYYEKWDKILYFIKKIWNVARRPAYVLLDFLGILFSFGVAYGIRGSMGHMSAGPLYPVSIYYKPLALFSVCSLSVYYLMGLYDINRIRLWVDRFLMVGKGTLISCIMMGLIFLFSSGYQFGFLYSRMVIVSFVIIAILVVTFLHQTIHLISRWLWRNGFNLRRLLLVGSGPLALNIQDALSNSPELGYDLAGVVWPLNSDNNSDRGRDARDLDKLSEMCRRERIQEVIFVASDHYLERIILPLIRLRAKFIDVRIVSTDLDSEAVDPRTKDFVGFSSFSYECTPSYYVGRVLKRIMDLMAALIALIVLSPVIALIGLKLSFEDGGAFFVQKRLGKGGQEFSMYKFRTMEPDAEKLKEHLNNMAQDGRLFKAENDARVTRFGRFLRKYNFDEIPQFFNVLKGEMSFIGPRPPLPQEVAQYKRWHKARLEVKPGITGLWQVDKERKWKFDEMVKLDIHYILNWSLLLDFKILLRTPGAILRGTGFEG